MSREIWASRLSKWYRWLRSTMHWLALLIYPLMRLLGWFDIVVMKTSGPLSIIWVGHLNIIVAGRRLVLHGGEGNLNQHRFEINSSTWNRDGVFPTGGFIIAGSEDSPTAETLGGTKLGHVRTNNFRDDSDGSVAVNTTHGAEEGATQASEGIRGPDSAYGEIRR